MWVNCWGDVEGGAMPTPATLGEFDEQARMVICKGEPNIFGVGLNLSGSVFSYYGMNYVLYNVYLFTMYEPSPLPTPHHGMNKTYVHFPREYYYTAQKTVSVFMSCSMVAYLRSCY
jgi:hypothetical protein